MKEPWWKKKKYPSTSSNKKKDAISLQSRTASPGEGAGQRTWQRQNASFRGTQSCRTSKHGSANAAGWLSTESGQLTLLCLLYQQGLGRSDYWTSTTFQEPSTDIGYKKKKRLAKSGKRHLTVGETSLRTRWGNSLYPGETPFTIGGKRSLQYGVKGVTI